MKQKKDLRLKMIKTVDNFYCENCENDGEIEKNKNYYFKGKINNKIKNLYLTLENLNIHTLFSEEVKDDFVLSIQEINNKFTIKTGNFIGKFKYENIEFEINSRFGEAFLIRMLEVVENVYFSKSEIIGGKNKKEDFSKKILYLLFIQKLEKAFLLGFPKEYQRIKKRDLKLKGKIDIKNFIKKDIPFSGKISYEYKEFKEVQIIIDIIYKAVKIIQKEVPISNISHILPFLKENHTKVKITPSLIKKAKKSKALKNPIFTKYKEVLNLAEIILNQNGFSGVEKNFGFLVDVASLFESYIYSLLRREFDDWDVYKEKEINLYENSFFERKIKPDIVMQKDEKCLVFDCKYKRMDYIGKNQYGLGDVDRCDFFQIHTYMSWFEKNYTLLAGGLIYPLPKRREVIDNYFGDKTIKFVIEGIEVDEEIDKIKKNEEKFLQNLKDLIKTTQYS
jgi:5-methylcytosine-specific restriction endonuclease McrBC regulatory subunit McrC